MEGPWLYLSMPQCMIVHWRSDFTGLVKGLREFLTEEIMVLLFQLYQSIQVSMLYIYCS